MPENKRRATGSALRRRHEAAVAMRVTQQIIFGEEI
jgi:hypothetical protein